MKYRIEISSVAEAEADSAFLQMSQVTSPEKASRWYEGLLNAIESGASQFCKNTKEWEHLAPWC